MKQACATSFKQAQLLRRKSQLLAAREELIACGQPSCPDPVESKCVEWLDEVREAIPTILVSASDPRGQDVIDADLVIDGKRVALKLDGAPIELDPGPHVVRVTRGKMTAKRELLAVQGRKNRQVQLELEVPPPPKPRERQLLPTMSWIGFGVGGAGAVVGSITGILAIIQGKEVIDACASARSAVPQSPEGSCFQFQKDDVESAAAIAHSSTVAFSVAGAGVLAGVIGLFAFKQPEPEQTGWSWQPLLGPASFGVQARF